MKRDGVGTRSGEALEHVWERVERCVARMSFRPFLPLMFIGDLVGKEAYRVPRVRRNPPELGERGAALR